MDADQGRSGMSVPAIVCREPDGLVYRRGPENKGSYYLE